jgi:group I intron endonuclease
MISEIMDLMEEKKMTYFLYLITNNFDSKCYVGYTNDIKRRMRQHRNPSKKEQYKHLYRAMAKHGRDNFFINVLEEHETKESVKKAETDVIKMFRDTGVKLYNHSDGGEGMVGYKHTDEAKLKMSIAKKGILFTDEHKANMSNAKKGIPLMEETKANISKSKKGMSFTDKHKENISKSKKGIAFTDEHKANLCGPFTEAHKQKLSDSHKGLKQTPESIAKRTKALSIPIIAIGKCGNMEFDSISCAATCLNLDPGNISKSLRGKLNKVGGYKFKYQNEDNRDCNKFFAEIMGEK